MAYPFPLSRADFQRTLKITEARFHDPVQQETSGLGSGQFLRADIGPQLWRGTAKLAPEYHDDAQAIEAMLSILSRAGASFFVFDPRRIGPRNDPDGSTLTLAQATPTIASIAGNNREMSIDGLPAGYVLAAGDMLSFEYTSGGVTLYALHRIVTGDTADGTGDTGLMEVTPPIRPGATASTEVELIRPYCKAVLVSAGYGNIRPSVDPGGEIEFVQTLG